MCSSKTKDKIILEEYNNMLKGLFFDDDATMLNENNKVIHSILYNMESMKRLFLSAMDSDVNQAIGSHEKSQMKNVLLNYYDNDNQAFGKTMVIKIAELATMVGKWNRDGFIKGIDSKENNDKSNDALFALTSMLRFAYFLIEERS
jgi:hypothetical protein